MTECSAWLQVGDHWYGCENGDHHPRLPHVNSDAQAVWSCAGGATELDEKVAEAVRMANELDRLKQQPT